MPSNSLFSHNYSLFFFFVSYAGPLVVLHRDENSLTGTSRNIMLKFPSQCVVTAESVVWTKDMSEALQNGSLRELSDLRYACCYGAVIIDSVSQMGD